MPAPPLLPPPAERGAAVLEPPRGTAGLGEYRQEQTQLPKNGDETQKNQLGGAWEQASFVAWAWPGAVAAAALLPSWWVKQKRGKDVALQPALGQLPALGLLLDPGAPTAPQHRLLWLGCDVVGIPQEQALRAVEVGTQGWQTPKKC